MDIKRIEIAERRIISNGPAQFSPVWITLILEILEFAHKELFDETGAYKPVKWIQFSRVWKIATFFISVVTKLIKII